MPANTDLEIKVIEKFVEKIRQDRFIQFVSSPKTRDRFIRELAHFKYFNWDLFNEIKKDEEQTILATLKANKVPAEFCYAISDNPDLDTHVLNTIVAIKEIVGYGLGTILVFGDADIIYYEGEGMKSRYISDKK